MTTTNLININVDQIFEQNSIGEIDAINRKIQAEIELKKENLRTMVGERYRDLILAADTIQQMKTTSSKISDHVNKLTKSCQELNNKQLIGFKSENEHQRKINRSINNNFYGIVVQIKILTSLPEMIWSFIDNEDYFVATQLFIFSRHISTGLKLDTNNDIMKKFPVAKKQWDLLSPFFFTIKQSCLQTLEREELSAETASKCLASLLLLENCQLEKLLSTFIQTRSKTYLSILQNENYGVVKEKMLGSVTVLINTVKLLHECFIGDNGDDGYLLKELKQISAENSKPTLSLINYEDSAIIQTLPDIIAKYKPQVFFIPLKRESLESTINSWLKTIENVSQHQLKSMVQLITSIKTVQDIQKQINKIEKPRNWLKICQDLHLPVNIDFFKKFYQNLINERIEFIINISWTNILDDLKLEVEKLFTDNKKVHRDMKSYVWTDDPLDTPLSLKDALSTNKQSHKLLMKVKGFSTSTVEVCNKIDTSLELLFNDLKMYLGDQNNVMEMRKTKPVDADHHKIILYLRECSKENISTLITSIKSSTFNNTGENCVMLARLLQAISELCPNLKLCFSGHLLMEQSYLRDPTRDDDGDKEWNNVCLLLEEESLRFWKLWVELFVKEWKQLDDKVTVITLLTDFPNWDTITIEEKDETDNTVQSQIYVPSQLSFSIQSYLYEIITQLNRIIPHTLPKSIHLLIVEKLVEKLADYYEKLKTNEFVNGNQKASWQYFLDLKVLALMFVGRENKSISERYQQLISHFKSVIDPFDFDVFYQHVNNNVKRNAFRTQCGFGCLIPNIEQLSGILANQSFSTAQDKDPNILTMSTTGTTVPWFPLLPIVSKESTAVIQPEPEKKKVSAPPQIQRAARKTQQTNVSTPSSALSSLQDWFR
ncbi:unnamed protein product [Diamesa serratosioi]